MPPEYPPEPTHSYDEDQRPEEEEEEDYDPYGPLPTQVTMITDDTFPYSTTTESHYAKEDKETMQVGWSEGWRSLLGSQQLSKQLDLTTRLYQLYDSMLKQG